MKTKLTLIKLISFSVFCLVVFSTCKKDQKLAPVIEKSPSKDYVEYNNEELVGSAGGKITFENTTQLKSTSITIPSGSISNTNKISIQIDNSKRPTGDTSSDLLKFELEGLTFAKAVTKKIAVCNTISHCNSVLS